MRMNSDRRCLDTRHVTPYAWRVIKTLADKRTQEFFATGVAKRFPPEVDWRAARKLEYGDLAASLDDLKVPPGNRCMRSRATAWASTRPR